MTNNPSNEPMACCGYKPSEGHNGCCTFYGEDVRAIMALCSRKPHSQDPKAGPAAVAMLREIEAIVAKARDRPDTIRAAADLEHAARLALDALWDVAVHTDREWRFDALDSGSRFDEALEKLEAALGNAVGRA